MSALEDELFEDELFELQNNINHSGISDFDGLSPNVMHDLLYRPFESSIMSIQGPLTKSEYESIPILCLMKSFLTKLQSLEKIKLTKIGNLPPKFVKELYNEKHILENYLESGLSVLTKETDARSIHLVKILAKLLRYTKTSKGHLSITRKGSQALQDDHVLFLSLFQAMTLTFNLGYFDNHSSQGTAQLGFAYTLYLLSKYGQQVRPAAFYAEKYFIAFPMLFDEFRDGQYQKLMAHSCYEFRSFERFLNYFGFIGLEENLQYQKFVCTTPLFHKFIHFQNIVQTVSKKSKNEKKRKRKARNNKHLN
jgi:hypothetical protein